METELAACHMYLVAPWNITVSMNSPFGGRKTEDIHLPGFLQSNAPFGLCPPFGELPPLYNELRHPALSQPGQSQTHALQDFILLW